MSTVASDVFTNNAYSAPSADLEITDPLATPDKIFSSQGRVNRLTYNARIVYSTVVMMLAALPSVGAYLLYSEEPSVMFWIAFVFSLVGLGIILVAAYVMILTTVKRMHDLNKNGFYMLFAIVPVVGTLYSIYISAASGSKEANRFGSSRPHTKVDGIVGWIGLAVVILGSIATYVDYIAKISAST